MIIYATRDKGQEALMTTSVDGRIKTRLAGAQGEHKLARGYSPVAVHSLHYLREPAFRDAVARYLLAERRAVDEEIEVLTTYGPFRRVNSED
jgi:predicted N-acyltransferase